jgi:hypothetical protein
MPFEHVVDHDSRFVIVRGSGEGSVAETADSARRLLEDQSIGTDYRFMFVVDEIALHPTSGEMLSIVYLFKQLRSRFKGRVGIVTSRVGRVTTAHLIAAAVDGGADNTRAFTTESQARQWLFQPSSSQNSS